MDGIGRKKACINCTLSSDYPDIEFDESGLCNVCRQFNSYKKEVLLYFKPYNEFKKMMSASLTENYSDYDCLLLFSGGKDSSYVLYRLVEEGYRVLTVTFDNGFISQQAKKNIKNIISKLHVRNIMVKHNRMNEIFTEDLQTNCAVCYGCFLALNSFAMKIASNYGISVIVSGLSRGQIFETKLRKFYNAKNFNIDKIERSVHLLRKMTFETKDKITELLGMNISGDLVDSIKIIDYYRYDNVTTGDIRRYLEEKDDIWRMPTDTGKCSTNCLINDVGIYIHQEKKGYHNYASQLNYDYLLGVSTKAEVEEKLNMCSDEEMIMTILKQIGYSKRICRLEELF